MIKRLARGDDASKVRTVDNPPAPPLPPLLPTTVGWRWPWLVGTLILTLTAGGLLLPALAMTIQLGTSSDEQYTGWVGAPRAEAYSLAVVVSLATFGLLCFRRWRPRTRNVIFALCALFGVACGSWGIHESAARRHIGPALVAAVNKLPRPPAATSLGPVALESDGGAPYLSELGEPTASRSWALPTDSAAAACVAVNKMLASESGWQPQGAAFLCEFTRRQGRVVVRITDNELGSKADRIDIFAYPDD
jgi:hypothetical protein